MGSQGYIIHVQSDGKPWLQTRLEKGHGRGKGIKKRKNAGNRCLSFLTTHHLPHLGFEGHEVKATEEEWKLRQLRTVEGPGIQHLYKITTPGDVVACHTTNPHTPYCVIPTIFYWPHINCVGTTK